MAQMHLPLHHAGTTTQSNGSGTYSYVPSPEGTYQPWWDMWYRYMQDAILSRSATLLTALVMYTSMSTSGVSAYIVAY